MQSCVQNITTVRYLLDLYDPPMWHQPQAAVIASCNKAVFPQQWRIVSEGWRSCAYIKGYNHLAGRKY